MPMTRQEFIAEIGQPFVTMLNGLYADLQKSKAAEKAWRKCVKKGRPPIYHAGYVGMFLMDIAPPDGWKP